MGIIEVIHIQRLSLQVLVSLTMIGKDSWKLWLFIEELHEPEPVLYGNLLTTAQHFGYRLCGILAHVPGKSICLILETRC